MYSVSVSILCVTVIGYNCLKHTEIINERNSSNDNGFNKYSILHSQSPPPSFVAFQLKYTTAPRDTKQSNPNTDFFKLVLSQMSSTEYIKIL